VEEWQEEKRRGEGEVCGGAKGDSGNGVALVVKEEK
jgi:hypothetical protein